jgi:uncharacterized phage protein (TIGR01671 family)
MKRVIKFRGQRADGFGWVFGDLLHWYDMEARIRRHSSIPATMEEPGGDLDQTDHEVEPETIGQFTGLQDKNGAEIYEGDIMSFGFHNHCEIVFHKGKFIGEYLSSESFTGDVPRHGEVIGNIHDKS